MEERNAGSKEKTERLTALFSLAAEGEEPQAPCLTAEEMAELIDEQGGNEAFARFQSHLSSCDRCYQEWLCLKKIASPSVKRGRIYQLSTTTKRKLTGTALAIAASIAVFLNIPRHQDTIFEQQAPVQDITPHKDIPAPAPASLQKKKAEKADNLLSPDAKSTLQEYQVEESRAVDKQFPLENKEGRSQPGSKMRHKPMAAGSVDTPARIAKEITELDNWMGELEMHCQSPHKKPSFWFTVKLEGEQLLQSQLPPVSDEKRTKIILLLQLLSEIGDEDSAVSQCRLIRSELAEDE